LIPALSPKEQAMASISVNKKTKHKRIVFTNHHGDRKTIYMGEADKRQTEAVKTHVENIVQAIATKSATHPLTAQWLMTLDAVMKKKLAGAGLIDCPEAAKLGPMLDSYLDERRIDSKPNTIRNLEAVADLMKAAMGENKNIREITPKDADAMRLAWIKNGWEQNTICRRLGIARQFMAEAIRRRIITDNPFKGMKTNTVAIPENFFYITTEMSEKILSKCPNAQWKAIFGLVRWGGLRCPSELVPLRWEHINWDEGRILVTSPKTERHPNGASRVIPLFPELEKILLEARDDAPDGSTHVLWKYRLASANLATTMQRIIWDAGFKPWDKLFINLRSTRETELVEQHPEHVVCKWLGNSKIIARRHYLQVRDEHFARALGRDAQTTRDETGATRKTTLHSAEPHGTADSPTLADKTVSNVDASRCSVVQDGAAPQQTPTHARDRNRTNQKRIGKSRSAKTDDALDDARDAPE
jgi:integrase